MARKSNDDERLDDASIERAIKYLEEPKATKKNACAILNIAYNTSRLDKLIENYKAKKEADAKRRAEKRGTPATPQEVSFIVTEYLAGSPIDYISKTLYRGTTFINSVLEEYHVPKRQSTTNYFKPELIVDEAIRDSFKDNEIVYSARYNCLARIIKLYSPGVYSIMVKAGEDTYHAYQPVWELASLDHLREKGIVI